MDPIKKVARHALGAACHSKRRKVASEGVGADIVPMLDLRHGDDTLVTFAVAGDRDDSLTRISAAIGLSDADRALFIADGFRGPIDDVATVRPGDLATRFGAGDLGVVEDVQVLGFDRAGPWVAISAAYRYVGRQVVFDEPQTMGEGDDPTSARGAMVDALVAGFEMQAKRIGPAKSIGFIAVAIGWLAVVDSKPVPTLCPCGSGRLVTDCCAT